MSLPVNDCLNKIVEKLKELCIKVAFKTEQTLQIYTETLKIIFFFWRTPQYMKYFVRQSQS